MAGRGNENNRRWGDREKGEGRNLKGLGKSLLSGSSFFLSRFAMVLGTLIVLLYVTAQIPHTAFRDNLLASAEYLEEKEDEFYRLVEDDRRTEIDNYADVIIWNIMYSIDGEQLWQKLMLNPFYSDMANEEYPMIELLQERIAEDKPADTIYDRYWHGMMIWMRPLFCVFTITQIRVVMMILLMGLLTLLSVQMWKRGLRVPAVAMWVAAVMTEYPMIALCMEYQAVWIIMISVSLLSLRCAKRPQTVAGLMIVSGVCCAFFDFLTTETVAIVVPLAIVLCLWEKEGRLQSFWQGALWLLQWGWYWGIAYIGTFVVKWGLVSLSIGQERFSYSLGMMFLRQGGALPYVDADCVMTEAQRLESLKVSQVVEFPQALSAVLVNLRLMLGLSGQASLQQMLMGSCAVLGILVCVLYLFHKAGEQCRLSWLLFLLGTVPILRMLVLNSHSIQHCMFVYRALFATILCVITGFVYMVDWEFVKKVLWKKRQ